MQSSEISSEDPKLARAASGVLGLARGLSVVVAAKSALAASEGPPKIVAMHPRVVDQYLRDLGRLDQLIADDLAAGDDGQRRRYAKSSPRNPSCVRLRNSRLKSKSKAICKG